MNAPTTIDPRTFSVALTFSVDDPETVARITIEVQARTHLSAGEEALGKMDSGSGEGFTRDDLLEITVTLSDPPVARNLLAHYRHH